jgi:hypothetical protein
MSKVRKEKNCLNCGHIVEELYCTHCGQKNIEPHENAFHAIGEFIGDYFHADGKFLKSLLPLLFRPGYMTNEYNAGRREKFIHPFRLYIFVSIVYFSISYLTMSEGVNDRRNIPGRSTHFSLGNSGVIAFQSSDSAAAREDSSIKVLNERAIKLPATIREYTDSIKALASADRPSFREDIYNRVAIKFKGSGDANGLLDSTLEKFRHTLPKLLFFLIPLAALLLKLFYLRRKRFYIDHLVHTLHLHSFIFLIMTIYSLVRLFASGNILFIIALLAAIFYFFGSMKKVYGQSYFKTFIKGTLLSITYSLCLGFIFAAGFFYIFVYD